MAYLIPMLPQTIMPLHNYTTSSHDSTLTCNWVTGATICHVALLTHGKSLRYDIQTTSCYVLNKVYIIPLWHTYTIIQATKYCFEQLK